MEKPAVSPLFGYTGAGYWGGAWYPYWSVMILTVLGGFFGLDHLWLRSPVTCLLKVLTNMLTFGSWWIYDMIQIFGDSDLVKKYGLTVPFFGAQGIGAGVFREEPGVLGDARSPFRWLAYMLLLFFPFGFDRAVAGDFPAAAVKFFMTFVPFAWPFLILWFGFEFYRSWIAPTKLWEEGAARPFPLSIFLASTKGTVLGPSDPGTSSSFGVCNVLSVVAKPIVDLAAGPIAAASGAAVAVENTVATVADSATKVVKLATDTTLPALKTVMQDGMQQKVDEKFQQMTGLPIGAMNPTALEARATSALSRKIGSFGLKGGGLSGDSLGVGAVGLTAALLLGSGLLLGALRIKHILAQNRNGKGARDDRPPEPRTV